MDLEKLFTSAAGGDIVGGGLSFLGSLFDDSKEKELEFEKQKQAEDLAFNRDELAQKDKQFGLGHSLEGLKQLGEIQNQALENQRKYHFGNAMYNALSGAA